MMPDRTHQEYADTTGSDNMLYSNIQRLIMQDDTFNYEDEFSLIYDMRQCNIRGNNETSEFSMNWKAAIREMETEFAHGAHERRNAAGDSDSTSRISHDYFISTNHITKRTIKLLEKYGLKQGDEFKVPSKSWVRLQLTSNNGQ